MSGFDVLVKTTAAFHSVLMDAIQAARLRALALVDIVPSVAARWTEALALTAQAGKGEVLVYGPIVDDISAAFMRNVLNVEPATGAGFRAALTAIAGDVTVRINSPGGDVHQASTMLTALQERRATGAAVHVVVDGMAASAASMLLLAGSDVRIAALGTVVIHEAKMTLVGASARDAKHIWSYLEQKNRDLAALYATRMQQREDEIRTLLAEERFYTAEEAVEVGLADEVIAVQAPAATNTTDTAVTALFRRRNLRLAALTEI